jgi:hypothetical protein
MQLAIRQHLQSQRAHVLPAVQVCSTGMHANFNQALVAWKVVVIHVLSRLPVPSHWQADYRFPVIPVNVRHKLLLNG